MSVALLTIFEHDSILTQDLLNLRLVSKSWCNAATSILLKRNACRVTLTKSQLRVPSKKDPNFKTNVFYSCRYQNTYKVLDDLTSLMSTSVLFPTTMLSIVGRNCKSKKKDLFGHSELESFFTLHGPKLKTLRLTNMVSINELHLYSSYLPNLECLELDNAHLPPHTNINREIEIKLSGNFKSLTTLRLLSPYKNLEKAQVLKLILNSAPTITSIENVNLLPLKIILEAGKGQCIADLTLPDPYLSSALSVQVMESISLVCASTSLSLTKLTLDILEFFKHSKIKDVINLLIMSCKDTVKDLELKYNPWDFNARINIPPMKNLNRLVLNAIDTGVRPYRYTTDSETDLDDGFIFRTAATAGTATGFESGKELAKNGSVYFPSLIKIISTMTSKRDSIETSVPRLFNRHLMSETATGENAAFIDTPTAKLSAVNHVTCHISETSLVPILFPHIRSLKLTCDSTEGTAILKNALWSVCSHVEEIELHGILCFGKPEEIGLVDQLFTGFSFEICEKIRNTTTESDFPPFYENKEFLKYIQMFPSVLDMPRLRVLKLQFREFGGQFASYVSGVFAFKKMPHTKIIISYDPKSVVVGNHDLGPDEPDRDQLMGVVAGRLAAVSPYAQIIHEEVE